MNNKQIEELVDLMFDTDMEEVMKEKNTLEYIHKLQQENKQLKEQLEILLEDNSQLEEIRIKATEYIKERFEINKYGEYYFTHTFDKCNMRELLAILGEKE
jgi:hypothetical protein